MVLSSWGVKLMRIRERKEGGKRRRSADQAGLLGIELPARHQELHGDGIVARAQARYTPATLARLADRCPNLVGFKDGVGDIEAMVAVYQKMGDRFSYLGGLPTAEVYAAAYKAMGTPVYSSAVFNFIPKTAMKFYEAVRDDDMATQHRLLKDFFMPYLEIRNRMAGYAVSIVKAGAKIVGHDAGPVRPPLTDLKADEVAQLAALIDKLGGE